jgi:hypothetical protein
MPPCEALSDIFPARPANAIGAALFFQRAVTLRIPDREQLIFNELMRGGNVPTFARRFWDVPITGGGHTGVIRVLSDYLTLGADDDFLRVPLSPITAQRIANAAGCLLPTKKIVDAIYRASMKQTAIPMPPPDKGMVLLPRIREHNRRIEANRVGALGDLLAGHKKDVVVTKRLAELPPKVAIYGFFRANGTPWQPFQLPHEAGYSDYSHGVRLISDSMLVNGEPRSLEEVLKSSKFAPLVSDEGVIPNPRYRIRPLK